MWSRIRTRRTLDNVLFFPKTYDSFVLSSLESAPYIISHCEKKYSHHACIFIIYLFKAFSQLDKCEVGTWKWSCLLSSDWGSYQVPCWKEELPNIMEEEGEGHSSLSEGSFPVHPGSPAFKFMKTAHSRSWFNTWRLNKWLGMEKLRKELFQWTK